MAICSGDALSGVTATRFAAACAGAGVACPPVAASSAISARCASAPCCPASATFG
eukprot:CAMPEP_0169457912 /NCGR_PEP_ID=MMETSP1042-20121227/17134_1 /TAXON_ID=464988 /ORGANISM="Hemiselmis andersenii, Strain CCMP1180" /LENGTH=54 /DNA_ID=CAMNT_0009570223 /DNA_START=14 /DNA_END=174 /DNA_ORIENTATION=+